jgi:hypothetical protein
MLLACWNLSPSTDVPRAAPLTCQIMPTAGHLSGAHQFRKLLASNRMTSMTQTPKSLAPLTTAGVSSFRALSAAHPFARGAFVILTPKSGMPRAAPSTRSSVSPKRLLLRAHQFTDSGVSRNAPLTCRRMCTQTVLIRGARHHLSRSHRAAGRALDQHDAVTQSTSVEGALHSRSRREPRARSTMNALSPCAGVSSAQLSHPPAVGSPQN